jgi:hypothetical protein
MPVVGLPTAPMRSRGLKEMVAMWAQAWADSSQLDNGSATLVILVAG